MDGLINQTKAQLWKIVNEFALAKYDGEMPLLEIALYEYGNDLLNKEKGYIRMVTDMTSDLDEISERLFGLRTNGGSEYCGEVIKHSVNNLKWSNSNDELKIIFIAGNEAFNQGKIDYKKSCKESIAKGIIVNTIFCGDYIVGLNTFWEDGATIADGKYSNIDQNIKTVYIENPFDDEIQKLNQSLNKTDIYFGSAGEKKKERQEIQDVNTATMGKVNSVNRTISKSSKIYKNKDWDLVDAEEEENFDITEVKEESLPKEMKTMNNEEKLEYMSPLRKVLKCKNKSFCKFCIFFICLIHKHLLHKIKFKIYQKSTISQI